MVIDSHEHIMFPTKVQLDQMDAAGVDKAIYIERYQAADAIM